jgi:hypothetical protein
MSQHPEVLAFSISQFCSLHNISRSKLYQLWAVGRGPRVKQIGRKKIITTEAAAEWRQRDDDSTAECTGGGGTS